MLELEFSHAERDLYEVCGILLIDTSDGPTQRPYMNIHMLVTLTTYVNVPILSIAPCFTAAKAQHTFASNVTWAAKGGDVGSVATSFRSSGNSFTTHVNYF